MPGYEIRGVSSRARHKEPFLRGGDNLLGAAGRWMRAGRGSRAVPSGRGSGGAAEGHVAFVPLCGRVPGCPQAGACPCRAITFWVFLGRCGVCSPTCSSDLQPGELSCPLSLSPPQHSPCHYLSRSSVLRKPWGRANAAELGGQTGPPQPLGCPCAPLLRGSPRCHHLSPVSLCPLPSPWHGAFLKQDGGRLRKPLHI